MKRLTWERMRREWTRAELARQAHLNASQVGLFESGRLVPYPSQLSKLAQALGLPEGNADHLMEEVGADELAAA